MADMSQSQARQAAIAAGHDAGEVDQFIQAQGGARTSAQRILSAFGVAGSTGTNDLTAYHSQKQAADTVGKGGGYLQGAVTQADNTAAGGGGGTGGGTGGGGGTVPDLPTGSGGGDPIQGLTSALTQPSTANQSQPQEPGGSGLRQNLGNRMYPANSAALAGLQRAY